MFRWVVRAAVLLGLLGAIGAVGFIWVVGDVAEDLPRIFNYEEYLEHSDQASYILSAEGKILRAFFEERRTVVRKEEIPEVMKYAAIAAEDADFYSHEGIDYLGIARAMWKNIRERRFAQGASTITQQVARSFHLTQEKNIQRKLREAVLARELERRLTKDELISLYLNQIYFGHGRYGVEEASRFYFGRGVKELGLAEAALLAGVINSPERLSPYKHPERALKRRSYVLKQMVSKGFVDSERGEAALEAPLGILNSRPRRKDEAPYFVDVVRRRIKQTLGSDRLKKGGLRIETTLSLPAQHAAEEAVRKGLAQVDLDTQTWKPIKRFSSREEGQKYLDKWAKKHGESLGDGKLIPVVATGQVSEGRALVDTLTGEGVLELSAVASRLKAAIEGAAEGGPSAPSSFSPLRGGLYYASATGNSSGDRPVLQPEIGPQAALVAIDPTTREVRALVGGDDADRHPFNRAIQARRQAGSCFKPIVYAAGVETGSIKEDSLFFNTPETYRLPNGKSWVPRNFSGKYDGSRMSLADALSKSVNVVAVQVLSRAGLSAVIDLARRMGLRGSLVRNYTLALGSAEVSPLEITNAMATLPADGEFRHPRIIRKVFTVDGSEIDVDRMWLEKRCSGDLDVPCAEAGQAMRSETARTMVRLMREVVLRGTAKKIRKLGRMAAGKTGTTNKGRNLWFMGFTAQLVTGVFVGYDDRRPIDGGTGGKYAAPIWLDFMSAALEGYPDPGFGEWVEPRALSAKDILPPTPPPEEAVVAEPLVEPEVDPNILGQGPPPPVVPEPKPEIDLPVEPVYEDPADDSEPGAPPDMEMDF